MVLLRSDQSVDFGLKWFQQIDFRLSAPGRRRFLEFMGVSIFEIVLLGGGLISVFFFNTKPRAAYIFFGFMLLVIIALLLGQTFTESTHFSSKIDALFHFLKLQIIGFVILFTSIFIRIAASLSHLPSCIRALPRSFRRLVLCTSPAQVPELVPGMEAGDSELRFAVLWEEFRELDFSDRIFSSLLLTLLFLPSPPGSTASQSNPLRGSGGRSRSLAVT